MVGCRAHLAVSLATPYLHECGVALRSRRETVRVFRFVEGEKSMVEIKEMKLPVLFRDNVPADTSVLCQINDVYLEKLIAKKSGKEFETYVVVVSTNIKGDKPYLIDNRVYAFSSELVALTRAWGKNTDSWKGKLVDLWNVSTAGGLRVWRFTPAPLQ